MIAHGLYKCSICAEIWIKKYVKSIIRTQKYSCVTPLIMTLLGCVKMNLNLYIQQEFNTKPLSDEIIRFSVLIWIELGIATNF